jgi:hypothetical protein
LPGSNKLYYLLAKLFWIRWSCSRHGELLSYSIKVST